MKVAWLAIALALPMLSGCLDFLGDDSGDRPVQPADVGYDPQQITVSGVAIDEITITSGSADLDTLVYVPQTQDSIDGEPVEWPVVILLHGWGFPKEMYTNMPRMSDDASTRLPAHDMMQEFAEGGLLTVAYDARGWYRSTGSSTVAGFAEMNDLRAVIDHINANYPSSGRIGVAGASYGGGQALLAWESFDDVVTAVPHQAWTDLYEGLAPGNALKAEWTAFLGAATVPGTHATGYPAPLTNWAPALTTRQDAAASDVVRADMESRSILDRAAFVDKPIMLCQGLQETLFPQSHLIWETAPGPTHAHYYLGGHATLDAECWSKTKAWFQFFIGGHETGVDTWPAVVSLDHNNEGGLTAYSAERIQEIDVRSYHLHGEQMVEYAAPNATWNVAQQVVSNPIHEPQALWDAVAMPNQAVPAQLRQDPTATTFPSPAMTQSETLLGAPRVTLTLDADATPFQVVATLYHDDGSNWRLLGRGATSPLAASHLDGTGENLMVTIDLPWMKADLAAGERLVLKLGANDETAFFPLPANFDAAFTGTSWIDLPFFDPSGSSQ